MKILQILPELNVGGVERGTVDLARQLRQYDHQAFVISNGGKLVQQLTSFGCRHIRLPVHKKSLFSILANVPKVARILKEENIDIVHARSRVPALIAFLACRRTGTNFVTTCHGYYSQHFFSRIMGWGKCVIVSSKAVAQHMIEDFTVPPERIRLIPRGVDLQRFNFVQKSEICTVGVVGRLTPIKGHQYFLYALARVIRVLPKLRVLIVGEASIGKEKYEEELKMLTRRLGLDRYVEFIGYEDNVPRILANIDVLVLPSIVQEAFGRVLIEAAACGVAIIATKVGGVVDIIHDGVNGILVAPADSGDLASAIIKIFKQPQLRQRLVLAARRNVEERFSLTQMVEKTIKVYEQVQADLKILVIKLSALGDVILAGPSLRALREHFPQAQITVLLARPYRIIFQDCPYINHILELPLESRGYRDAWKISAPLRRLNFDIVVDLQNSRKSHILAYLSGSSRRYGYSNGKFSCLLNLKVTTAGLARLSPIQQQAQTLSLLDIKSVKEDLELWPSQKDHCWAEDFLKRHKREQTTCLIGINLGASPTWPSKKWPIEKIALLLTKMQDLRMQALVTGKGRDKKLVQALRQHYKGHLIDAVDQTSTMQLACLIQRCNVYITGDSAPLHIAYAMQTPVVVLFGPTDPRRHTIRGAKQVIINKEVSCAPCYNRRCRRHICMEDIEAEEVLAAIKKLK